MPKWDFRCGTCGNVEEHTFESHYAMLSAVHDEGEPRCGLCYEEMYRLPAAPNFSVQGFNAKNGYSGGNK